MGEIAHIMHNHLSLIAKKRDRGMIYVVSLKPKDSTPTIVILLGTRAIAKIDCFDDHINLKCSLPGILQPDTYRHTINMPKLKRHKVRKLIMEALGDESAFRLMRDELFNWPSATFDLCVPYSISRAEYYINKLITLTNRFIKQSGNRAWLKEKYDELPDLLDSVTEQYETNVLKRKRK